MDKPTLTSTDRLSFVALQPTLPPSTAETREELLKIAPRLGPSATLLLLHLSRLMADDSVLDTSYGEVASAIGLSPNSLGKTIRRLRRFGLVLIDEVDGGQIITIHGALS